MELEVPSSDIWGFQYMNVWRNIGKTGGLENNCLYRTGPCMAGHLAFVALTSKQERPTLFQNTPGGWIAPFRRTGLGKLSGSPPPSPCLRRVHGMQGFGLDDGAIVRLSERRFRYNTLSMPCRVVGDRGEGRRSKKMKHVVPTWLWASGDRSCELDSPF